MGVDPLIKFDKISPKRLVPHEQTSIYRISELLPDIAKNGIKTPIAVTKIKNKYIILDGHHRWYVSLILGMKEIPIAIFNYFSKNLLVLDYKTKKPLDKEKIIEEILKGKIFPPKTTYHAVKYNGTTIHISKFLQIVLDKI